MTDFVIVYTNQDGMITEEYWRGKRMPVAEAERKAKKFGGAVIQRADRTLMDLDGQGRAR